METMVRNALNSLWIGLAAGILASSGAFSQTDPMIEGAKNCTRFLPHYETQYGIPVHLLSAISSTESGRWHNGLKISLPWPWTINAEGKGYYLNSKEEAVATARKLQARGVKSMDVGCMQVNLMYHPRAFANLEDAFDPDKNIAYAASFLRNLYESEGGWKEAAAAYHSKTPSLGSHYVGLVYNKWYTIIDKLRMARSMVANTDIKTASATPSKADFAPQSAVYRLDKNAQLKQVKSPPAKSIKTQAQQNTAVATAAVLGEQEGKTLAAQKPVRMKIIKVADSKPSPEKGIIVLRPDSGMQMANITRLTTPDPAIGNNSQIVKIAAAAPSAAPSHSAQAENKGHAPRFIFAD